MAARADSVEATDVVAVLQSFEEPPAHGGHFGGAHASGRDSRRSDPDAARAQCGARVIGDDLPVAGHASAFQHALGARSIDAKAGDCVEHQQVIFGSARHE